MPVAISTTRRPPRAPDRLSLVETFTQVFWSGPMLSSVQAPCEKPSRAEGPLVLVRKRERSRSDLVVSAQWTVAVPTNMATNAIGSVVITPCVSVFFILDLLEQVVLLSNSTK